MVSLKIKSNHDLNINLSAYIKSQFYSSSMHRNLSNFLFTIFLFFFVLMFKRLPLFFVFFFWNIFAFFVQLLLLPWVVCFFILTSWTLDKKKNPFFLLAFLLEIKTALRLWVFETQEQRLERRGWWFFLNFLIGSRKVSFLFFFSFLFKP